MTNRSSEFKGMSAGFVEAVSNFPNRPALEVAGQSLSYKELFERASSIAATIQRHARPAKTPLTAVLAHRSQSAFSGILGALLSGNCY